MKKGWIFTLFLLTSCGGSKKTIPLFHVLDTVFSAQNKEDVYTYELTPDSLSALLEKRASFPLFIYSQGCGTCDNFSYVYKDYIEQNKVLFPMMRLSLYLDVEDKPFRESTLVLYEDGEVKAYKQDLSETFFTTKDLTKYLDKYCYDSKVTNENVLLYPETFFAPYNSYTLSSYIKTPELQDGQSSYSPFSLKDGTYLFLEQDFNYKGVEARLETEDFDFFLFYGEEKKKDEEALKSLLQYEETSGDFLLTYEDSKLIDSKRL